MPRRKLRKAAIAPQANQTVVLDLPPDVTPAPRNEGRHGATSHAPVPRPERQRHAVQPVPLSRPEGQLCPPSVSMPRPGGQPGMTSRGFLALFLAVLFSLGLSVAAFLTVPAKTRYIPVVHQSVITRTAPALVQGIQITQPPETVTATATVTQTVTAAAPAAPQPSEGKPAPSAGPSGGLLPLPSPVHGGHGHSPGPGR